MRCIRFDGRGLLQSRVTPRLGLSLPTLSYVLSLSNTILPWCPLLCCDRAKQMPAACFCTSQTIRYKKKTSVLNQVPSPRCSLTAASRVREVEAFRVLLRFTVGHVQLRSMARPLVCGQGTSVEGYQDKFTCPFKGVISQAPAKIWLDYSRPRFQRIHKCHLCSSKDFLDPLPVSLLGPHLSCSRCWIWFQRDQVCLQVESTFSV